MNEFSDKRAAFSRCFGFIEMCDAEDVFYEQLPEMAKRESFDLYK